MPSSVIIGRCHRSTARNKKTLDVSSPVRCDPGRETPPGLYFDVGISELGSRCQPLRCGAFLLSLDTICRILWFLQRVQLGSNDSCGLAGVPMLRVCPDLDEIIRWRTKRHRCRAGYRHPSHSRVVTPAAIHAHVTGGRRPRSCTIEGKFTRNSIFSSYIW